MRTALLITCLAFLPATAHADSVAALMPRVEAKLIELGHDVKGYSRLPAPTVRTAEMPRSIMARIDGMTITLNSQATPGCEDVLVAHELAHDALYRMLKMSGRSAESEDAATEVAWSIAEDPYKPNCVTGNRQGGRVGDYESQLPNGPFPSRR